MTMENNSLERLDLMSIKRTNKEITAALEGSVPSDADTTAALEGRDPAGAEKQDRLQSALEGRSPDEDTRADRLTAALRGDDPEREQRDAQLTEVLEGRGDGMSWQDRMDMELAVEAYRDALLKKYPASGTLDTEMRRAVEIRDKFMEDHRAQHASKEELWKTTVAFMNSLATHTLESIELRDNGERRFSITEDGDPQTRDLREKLHRAQAAGDHRTAVAISKELLHQHNRALWEQGALEDGSGKTRVSDSGPKASDLDYHRDVAERHTIGTTEHTN